MKNRKKLCVAVMAAIQDVIYCFIFNDWNSSALCAVATERDFCLEQGGDDFLISPSQHFH